jgi:hypothetical protein
MFNEVRKGKDVPVHDMKLYWGSKGMAPVILNLDTRWEKVFIFTLRPL